MQTLIFNTTLKTVILFEGNSDSKPFAELRNIPTVKFLDGFYEVIQSDEFEKKYPILRVPISNTNMFIEK